MASVSSLDKDMRNIRMSKYTPQAADEARTWIESVLGERLATGDLLAALKDGIALCKLVNLAAPPGVRFKQSSMPFVQMENISHFLRACQSPPINLQSHDIFQTVDLYESKDPAQVLQCIAAFSRRAHAVQPSRFTSAIGEKNKNGVVSPQSTGGYSASPNYGRTRGISETSSTISSQPSIALGGRGSPFRAPEKTPTRPVNGGSPHSSSGGVSSWSSRTDEGATTPAWNIHQYGYMGGASQGNQGITFGGRRQITTSAPKVPSLAEKERKKREQEAETERLRIQAEEAEHKRKVEREADEERERMAEEQRWEEETERRREAERKRVEEEKRRWQEEERKWKEEEEAEAEARLEKERQQKRSASDVGLTGQFLSQYKADQSRNPSTEKPERAAERTRVQELERQLEEAKEREAQYERERQERVRAEQGRGRSHSGQEDISSHGVQPSPRHHARSKSRTETISLTSYQKNKDPEQSTERDLLRKEWETHQSMPPPQPPRPLPTLQSVPPPQSPRPLPIEESVPPPQPPRPLPTHDSISPPQPPRPLPTPQPSTNSTALPTSILTRPLPNPATYSPRPPSTSPQRKSPFARPTPRTTTITPTPAPPSTTKTTTPLPPTTTSSSLLSREMELDRLRQQEWEESQQATKAAAAAGLSGGEGSAPGEGAWDVHQYGYLGGDSQNRGARGIGFGSGRRQLVGPREMGGK